MCVLTKVKNAFPFLAKILLKNRFICKSYLLSNFQINIWQQKHVEKVWIKKQQQLILYKQELWKRKTIQHVQQHF